MQVSAGDYSENVDAQKFFKEMKKRHDYDESELRKLFSQVYRDQRILDLISKPAEKRLAWRDYREIFLDNARIKNNPKSNKIKIDNKVEYKANINHPLFDILRKVVLKHLGLEDMVETVLNRMGNVNQIILVGDYAKGIDSGKIEVFLIGDSLDMEYIAQLEDKIEKLISRKVSFYLANKFLSNQPNISLFNLNDQN